MNFSGVTHKKCTHCKKKKLTKFFYKAGRGFSSWCKKCHREWSKAQQALGYFSERRRRKGLKRIPRNPVQKFAADLFRAVSKRCRYRRMTFSITQSWVIKKVETFC